MFPVVCSHCRTRFALGLMRCPRCQKVSPQYAANVKEEYMPRITVADGPSNAAARPGEVGYIEHEVVVVAEEVAAEVHVAADWASKPLAHLREAAKNRGLTASGSKSDLAARLTEHEAGQAATEVAPESESETPAEVSA